MSKGRKKVFPKAPQRLTSDSAKLLGKNSNKVGYEASKKAIYNQEPKLKDALSPEQRKMLDNLKRNLASRYQPE